MPHGFPHSGFLTVLPLCWESLCSPPLPSPAPAFKDLGQELHLLEDFPAPTAPAPSI